MSTNALAGLSPEQIAQQLQVEQGDERLRQQSVASLVSGYQGMPAMDLQQAQVEHLGAQTGALRETTPGLSAAQAAATALNRQHAESLRAADAARALTTPGTIEHVRAQTEALRSTTRAQDLLGNLPAQRIQAEIDKLNESKGIYTDLKLDDGSTVSVTGAQLLEAKSAAANRDRATAVHNDALEKQLYELKRTQGLDEQKRLETAAEAQKFLENPAMEDNPANIGQINLFNATSDERYIYHFNPEAGRRSIANPNKYNPFAADSTSKVQKIPIPITLDMNGNRIQRSARWVAHQAALKYMSPEEFVRTLMLPHAVK